MSDDDGGVDNPYAPPQVSDVSVGLWPPRVRRIPILSSLGLAAYTIFVGLLLDSEGIDRMAGGLMLVNLVILVTVTVVVMFRGGHPAIIPAVGVGGQAAVTAIMLLFSIGDPSIVVLINGGIICGFAAIAMIYFVWPKHRQPGPDSAARLLP